VLFELLQCGTVHRCDNLGVELCCLLILRQGLIQELREVQTEEICPCRFSADVWAGSGHHFCLLTNSKLQIPALATSWE